MNGGIGVHLDYVLTSPFHYNVLIAPNSGYQYSINLNHNVCVMVGSRSVVIQHVPSGRISIVNSDGAVYDITKYTSQYRNYRYVHQYIESCRSTYITNGILWTGNRKCYSDRFYYYNNQDDIMHYDRNSVRKLVMNLNMYTEQYGIRIQRNPWNVKYKFTCESYFMVNNSDLERTYGAKSYDVLGIVDGKLSLIRGDKVVGIMESKGSVANNRSTRGTIFKLKCGYLVEIVRSIPIRLKVYSGDYSCLDDRILRLHQQHSVERCMVWPLNDRVLNIMKSIRSV